MALLTEDRRERLLAIRLKRYTDATIVDRGGIPALRSRPTDWAHRLLIGNGRFRHRPSRPVRPDLRKTIYLIVELLMTVALASILPGVCGRRLRSVQSSVVCRDLGQASEFGCLGVRVNAISPGEIDTNILSPGTDEIVERLRSKSSANVFV
jgi:hypothetical protein